MFFDLHLKLGHAASLRGIIGKVIQLLRISLVVVEMNPADLIFAEGSARSTGHFINMMETNAGRIEYGGRQRCSKYLRNISACIE